MRQAADFEGLVRLLASHRIEFIVVGGVAAALQGAPITTFDLDVVHDRSTENIRRILRALGEIHAVFRTHPHVPVTAEHLAAEQQLLLTSDLGPLDLLGFIGDHVTYEDLLPLSEELSLEGTPLRVMTLPALIAHKKALGRDKDKWVVAILERTFDERSRQ